MFPSTCLHIFTKVWVDLFKQRDALLGTCVISPAVVSFDALLSHSSPKYPCTLPVLLSSAKMKLDYPFTSGLQGPYGAGDILLHSCDVERQAGVRIQNVFVCVIRIGNHFSLICFLWKSRLSVCKLP